MVSLPDYSVRTIRSGNLSLMDTIAENFLAISEGINIETVSRSFLTSAIESSGAHRGVLLRTGQGT